MKATTATAIAFLWLAAAALAAAATLKIDLPEPALRLKPGPGAQIAMDNCQGCHSLDYITTQPPHRDRAFWDAAVRKMVDVYGAPISEEDAKTIAAYLAAKY